MHVRVLYFGALREQLDKEFEALDLSSPARVSDLLGQIGSSYPDLKSWLPSLAVAVNQEYANLHTHLKEGDEIALLPPVSGGVDRARIVRQPIDTRKILASLMLPEDGAALIFEGVVRDNTRGRRTLYLDYEAYEGMALKKMEQLASQAIVEKKVRDVAIVHRLGRIEIGDSSVVIAVASAHRAAAFEACRWLIDTLKQTVPIWKKEYFEDGAVWADGRALSRRDFPGRGHQILNSTHPN